MKKHHYKLKVTWTGNLGTGTSKYDAYSRDHVISAKGKSDLLGSADPAFRGDASKYNPEEATLLINHLKKLLETITLNEPFKIGIISPYSAQVSYLEDLIKEDSDLRPCLPYIRVSSVDGFQGQECNVIYISLVRSNEQGEVGFLSDTRRMNVALTRAKQKLVVIGDSATLGLHKFYQDFLAYVESIGAYKSAWEFLA